MREHAYFGQFSLVKSKKAYWIETSDPAIASLKFTDFSPKQDLF